MPDQREMIENYLDELRLTVKGWRVFKPAYGDILDIVQLQNEKEKKEVILYLPRKDLEDLSPDSIKKRILDAISKAVKRY